MTIINAMSNLKEKIFNKENYDTEVLDDKLQKEKIETTENKASENIEVLPKDVEIDKSDLLDLALITNGAENTNLNFGNYFLSIKNQLQEKLTEKQFTDSDITFLTNIMTEIVAKFIKNIQEKYNSLQELMKLETFFGGEKHFNEVAKQITMWATKNLPQDLFNTLNTNYFGVISLYNMMRNDDDKTFMAQEFAKDFLTEQDLKSMMKNPKYWRDKDKNFIQQIDDGWKYLDSVKT